MESSRTSFCCTDRPVHRAETPDVSPVACNNNTTSSLPGSSSERGLRPDNNVDIIVCAGGKAFPSNKDLLSNQSEYFNNVLNENGVSNMQPPNNINLPTIPHDYFAILLAGMHSRGNFRSYLNKENVYQVLLYSQLLQIPNAMSQCREFITDQYLNARSLGNMHINPSSIDNVVTAHSNEDVCKTIFSATSKPCADNSVSPYMQTFNRHKIVKPIPNRIPRGAPQTIEEGGNLNWNATADLNDVWKTWFQQYHQRLLMLSNSQQQSNIIPFLPLNNEDNTKGLHAETMGLFDKQHNTYGLNGETASCADIRTSLQERNRLFSEPLMLTHPYLAAAATAAAIQCSTKDIPVATAPPLLSRAHNISSETRDRNTTTHGNIKSDKNKERNLKLRIRCGEAMCKFNGKEKNKHSLSLMSKFGDIPFGTSTTKDVEQESQILPMNLVEDPNCKLSKLKTLCEKSNFKPYKGFLQSQSLDKLAIRDISIPNRRNKDWQNESDKNIRNRLLQEISLTPSNNVSEEFTRNNELHSHLDVAACDGPVRFHKVMNSMSKIATQLPLKRNNDHEGTKGANEPGRLQDHTSRISDYATEASTTGEIYECPYCGHIFKSHYCYQKHKRRHIHPFTTDFRAANESSPANIQTRFDQLNVQAIQDLSTNASRFSGIKEGGALKDTSQGKACVLRDINVQFYPCKICGAKFPSYYFVHKHKKMWHAAEENLSAQDESSQDRLKFSSSPSDKLEKNQPVLL